MSAGSCRHAWSQRFEALAEPIKLKPEVNLLARFRAYRPWIANAPSWALPEKIFNAGLCCAGFRDQQPDVSGGGRSFP
jgi:hypothetical protein